MAASTPARVAEVPVGRAARNHCSRLGGHGRVHLSRNPVSVVLVRRRVLRGARCLPAAYRAQDQGAEGTPTGTQGHQAQPCGTRQVARYADRGVSRRTHSSDGRSVNRPRRIEGNRRGARRSLGGDGVHLPAMTAARDRGCRTGALARARTAARRSRPMPPAQPWPPHLDFHIARHRHGIETRGRFKQLDKPEFPAETSAEIVVHWLLPVELSLMGGE